ncbi:hypothetical protein C2845_PM06G14690 [Panicum miliaceum]|uniref:Uncharacterized protein n=1 Tax=Panicum miliaceum TaxID=4540 RepID=A0A3L6R4Y5_PANMI|nr:hypothetical protein C2845_PM06G14690 [Panicum miliaceum]
MAKASCLMKMRWSYRLSRNTSPPPRLRFECPEQDTITRPDRKFNDLGVQHLLCYLSHLLDSLQQAGVR